MMRTPNTAMPIRQDKTKTKYTITQRKADIGEKKEKETGKDETRRGEITAERT